MLYSAQRGSTDLTVSQSYLKHSMYLTVVALVVGWVSALLRERVTRSFRHIVFIHRNLNQEPCLVVILECHDCG